MQERMFIKETKNNSLPNVWVHSAFVFLSREKQPFINNIHPPPFSEVFPKYSFPQSRGKSTNCFISPAARGRTDHLHWVTFSCPSHATLHVGLSQGAGGEGRTQGFVSTCVLEPNSCQSATHCVRELTTRLTLRDANPIRKGDFKTGLGSPCSTVVSTDALHSSVSSFTPRPHGESCLQNPQACVLCFLRLHCAYVSRWQLRHLCICSHGSLPAVESFVSQI